MAIFGTFQEFTKQLATYYLEATEEQKCCPVDLVTNHGTGNGFMAGIHAFFQNEPDSYRCVSLPWKQIIEGWWSFLRRSHVSLWINFLKDICDQRTTDLTSQLEKECPRFALEDYFTITSETFKRSREHWHTHYI